MKFAIYLFNLILNIKRNTSFSQFILFLILFLVLMAIGVFAFIKIALPFTYIAL
jgi:hypothetical protein